MINRKFAQQLINQTVPTNALDILKRIYGSNARQEIGFLLNLEEQMEDFARASSQWTPLPYQRFYFDFDDRLRHRLLEFGNRVNLNDFKPLPLLDPSVHDNLAGRAEEAGIKAEFGSVESVKISRFGAAEATQSNILRLSKNNFYIDVHEQKDSFHIVRLQSGPETNGVWKSCTLSDMVGVLHWTNPLITGKPAIQNDRSVYRADGSWRFQPADTVWGIKASRLEHFFFKCGAVPARLVDTESPLLYFLRTDEALKFVEEFKQLAPDKPSPFAHASRYGLYNEAELKMLRG